MPSCVQRQQQKQQSFNIAAAGAAAVEVAGEAAAQGAFNILQTAADNLGQSGDKPLEDVEQALKGSAESHLGELETKREKWMGDICEGRLDLEGDVEAVFDITEQLVAAARGSQSNQSHVPINIQTLELRKRSALEQGFAKYSSLGTVSVHKLVMRFIPLAIYSTQVLFKLF